MAKKSNLKTLNSNFITQYTNSTCSSKYSNQYFIHFYLYCNFLLFYLNSSTNLQIFNMNFNCKNFFFKNNFFKITNFKSLYCYNNEIEIDFLLDTNFFFLNNKFFLVHNIFSFNYSLEDDDEDMLNQIIELKSSLNYDSDEIVLFCLYSLKSLNYNYKKLFKYKKLSKYKGSFKFPKTKYFRF